MDAQRYRHRSFDEGLRCEPLLAVPLVLALLALGALLMALLQPQAPEAVTDFWVGACTLFIVGHCGFVAVYDSPGRHRTRLARGCPHISPAPLDEPASGRAVRR